MRVSLQIAYFNSAAFARAAARRTVLAASFALLVRSSAGSNGSPPST
jgi:hypothetical protein